VQSAAAISAVVQRFGAELLNRSFSTTAPARHGGGSGGAQAELRTIPETVGREILCEAHVNDLDLAAERAGLAGQHRRHSAIQLETSRDAFPLKRQPQRIEELGAPARFTEAVPLCRWVLRIREDPAAAVSADERKTQKLS